MQGCKCKMRMLLVLLVVACIYTLINSGGKVHNVEEWRLSREEEVEGAIQVPASVPVVPDVQQLMLREEQQKKLCDLTHGKWIHDPSMPLYTGEACRNWWTKKWACRKNTSRDLSYEQYRWQPQDCELPRFNAMHFLRRMTNKTIAFAGDSIGRQQFQSLMCMLSSGLKAKHAPANVELGTSILAGRFHLTNTTILHYWTPTLCEKSSDLSTNKKYPLHLDRVSSFLRSQIRTLDVVVVNTRHHWNRGKLKKNKWEFYYQGKPTKVSLEAARRMAVSNVVHWLDEQARLNPRLKVFVRTMSPRHFLGGDWDSGGTCSGLKNISNVGSGGVKSDPDVEQAVKDTSSRRVSILDITQLSSFRGGAHIANYQPGRRHKNSEDCMHWCLPGVPDTWNEILAAFLLRLTDE